MAMDLRWWSTFNREAMMPMSLMARPMAAQGKPMRLQRVESKDFTKGESMSQQKCQ